MPNLRIHDLPGLTWHEIDLGLIAHAAPRRAHPLAVLEGVLKGAFEEASLEHRLVKQIWHVPNTSVQTLTWQAGTPIPLRVQLFGIDAAGLADWQDALHARFAPSMRQNFDLSERGDWREMHPPSDNEPPCQIEQCWLDFLTPVPLPHTAGQANTALDGTGFLRLAQTRLRKLFGREAELPPPPVIDTSAWRYWRTKHHSRSQGGNPMFLNGCIGSLRLSGESLPDWHAWIALFSAIGLGERLSFAQGRFRLDTPTASEPLPTTDTVPLCLRRPYVLDSELVGAKLKLDNANLVVTHEQQPQQRLPLMRLASLTLQAPIQLSSALLHACADQGIPVILAAPGQTPLVIVGQAGEAQRYQTLAAHHAAWVKLDAPQRARLAAKLIDAKLAACALVVRQRYQAGDHTLLAQLERARTALAHSQRIVTLRGWEGWAARHYYRWLGRHTSGLAELSERRKHGDYPDPINALLNYTYTLLRHRIAVRVRRVGLDPYLGILHEANGRHEALVSDLMEPWRPFVDRMILRLIKLRVIQASAWHHEEGQLRLDSQTRLRLVQEFTRMMETPFRNGSPKLARRIEQSISGYLDAMLTGQWGSWQAGAESDSQMDDSAQQDDSVLAQG